MHMDDIVQQSTGPALTATVRPWARGVVIAPMGELDHDTAGILAAVLEEVLEVPEPWLLVDCGRLAFCDSTGLSLLLRARLAAERAGGRLDLAAPGPTLRWLLSLTGTTELFSIHRTPADARSAGTPGPGARRRDEPLGPSDHPAPVRPAQPAVDAAAR
ncbi:STAS domain-containing protein [Kitasatospora sp. NPDC052896]|uniref:STAS domain-containing protein n=1 Tax=Kitasatospora sp. NPDC052896 TaxID=3364061 RepID=UPI0037C6FEBA